MIIETKFDMDQVVIIKEINQVGQICKIIQDGKNLFYEVCYWWEGQLKFVSLYERELK
jgi:hypothetical protein